MTALFRHESPHRRTPDTEKKRSIRRIIDTSAFEEDEGVNEGYGPRFSAIRSLSPEGDISNKLRAKERRRRSVALNMLESGDSLRLADNPRIAAALAKNGESTVRFSASVAKVNRQNKIQERLMVITDGALYNIHSESLKVKRRIAMSNISHVSTSRLRDNFFVVHVPTEYDYVYVSEHKMEIMTLLQKLHQTATGMEMPLIVENVLSFRTDRDQERRIEFIVAPEGVLVQVYGKKAK